MIVRCKLGTAGSHCPAGVPNREASASLYLRVSKPQRGAIAVMFAAVLLVMIGFCGLALDLGQLYNRRVEMQTVADVAALAAARELDGTSSGVSRAVEEAARVLNDPVSGLRYRYNNGRLNWSDSAIKFGSSPLHNGDWRDASSARAVPGRLLYVKVDTTELDSAYGAVNTIFMEVLSQSLSTVHTSGRAIAGRSSINVTPLAVCAMSGIAGESRAGELVEYGFRRGVSYDLMRLNPGGTTPENFLVDPITPPGRIASSSNNTSLDTVKPFVCTGTMAMPSVTGGAIRVERSFPIGSLYNQLNSRFDLYSAPCSPNSAPPDANIKSYAYNSAVPWMSVTPDGQAAQSTTTGGKLWTVADPAPVPGGTTGRMYGPLWSFARAVKFSSYIPGSPEPSAGYTTYNPPDWATLYNSDPPSSSPVATGSYPSSSSARTPYLTTGGTTFQAPSSGRRGVRNRRVLNVPLLACPVPAGTSSTATVLAIAKFFMTVPATSSSLYAEFAGVVPEQALGGNLELYP